MKIKLTYIFTITFLSLIAQIALSQDLNEDKYNQGVTSFTSGNFQAALDSWTDLYDTGYRSANLNYNIGNAYFKLNNIPSAILFYERAWLLKPSDENINYNLQIARTLAVDRFKEIPELFFVRWYNYISLIVSANAWAIFSLVTFILSLLLFSLYIYTSRYKFKVLGFWISLLFFVLSVSSLSLALRNKNLVYDSHKAIISIPLVSGKSSPDNSGTDLFVLHEGTKVSIEDEVGEWFEIRLSDGNKGWVPVNSLNII
jgi:tetratricopeptide (TPR) repeat protein